MEDYGITGVELCEPVDMDEQVKKYAAEDVKALSGKVVKEMDTRHLETLKEQAKAYSRDEQLAVACSIKADVLLEALGVELARLNGFEASIIKTVMS